MAGLDGHKIAFLAKRGFEQDELTEPWKAVLEAGGQPVLVSEEPGMITGLVGDWDRGIDVPVDLINAGAYWVDSEFHRDGNLLSSRSPRDIYAFNRGIVAVFEEVAAQKG